MENDVLFDIEMAVKLVFDKIGILQERQITTHKVKDGMLVFVYFFFFSLDSITEMNIQLGCV